MLRIRHIAVNYFCTSSNVHVSIGEWEIALDSGATTNKQSLNLSALGRPEHHDCASGGGNEDGL